MIVLDPPSFARNKKSLSRSKDYGELVKDSLDILAEDGILIASTNAANVSIEQFQTMIEEEFHAKMFLLNNLLYIVCQRFPDDGYLLEGNYLKVFVYQIKITIRRSDAEWFG